MPNTPDHSTNTSPTTYAIAYGISEGNYMSRSLRKALEAAGYIQAKLAEADIVITHSAGCLVVPSAAKAKLYLHINPPYWPGKPLAKSLAHKLVYDFRLYRQRHQLRRWANSLAANAIYSLNLRHSAHVIWSYIHIVDKLASLPDSNHVFIRTHIDSYCDPRALLAAIGEQHSYLTLAGHHDDCWREPEQYVQLTQSLYR